MDCDINLWGGEFGPVKWEQGSKPTVLRAEFGDQLNGGGSRVTMFVDLDNLVDLVEHLASRPEVVEAMAQRAERAAARRIGEQSVDDVSDIAKDYFRRGFAVFGEQQAHYAVQVVDNG